MKSLQLIFKYTILSIIAIIMFFPVYWMISGSLMTRVEIIKIPPNMYPKSPTLENFLLLIKHADFLRYMMNSIYIVTVSTAVSVFTSIIAGYIFAKFSFSGKKLLFILILATTMIPFQTYMVPFYILTQRMGLIDAYLGIMMPLFVTSFGIFFIRQNTYSIPDDYIDAARIDGAGEWHVFSKLILPMLKASASALTIFQFLFGWKFFIWPLIVTNSAKKFSLEIGLQIFASQNPLDYQLQMAGAVFGMIPILLVFLFFRRQFINGISLTGIK